MLKINNLTIEVEKKIILKDFNLEINDGEVHCLMGPNGTGKSTIVKSILNDSNYKKTEGCIIYNDEDITNLETDKIARKGIMLINQNPISVEGVTNAEMLRSALREKNNEHIDIFKFNKELESICEMINLPKEFIHRNINEGMSGGERKKNELLHLWMLKPSLILLDEIDSGLDVDALKIVLESIKKYYENYKCSILLITHNLNLLEIIKPDYIHIMKDKKIMKTGHEELIKEINEFGFDGLNMDKINR